MAFEIMDRAEELLKSSDKTYSDLLKQAENELLNLQLDDDPDKNKKRIDLARSRNGATGRFKM